MAISYWLRCGVAPRRVSLGHGGRGWGLSVLTHRLPACFNSAYMRWREPRAVMAHSFYGGLRSYQVNGQPIGEIWMNCYTAGLAHVPCLFLSGDRAAAEGRKLL